MVCSNQQTKFISWHDLYTIEVDRGNRNCYSYRGFGDLARNCRNRRIEDKIGKSKRLEYKNKNNRQNNLNRDRDLIVLDQVLVITTDLQCSVE